MYENTPSVYEFAEKAGGNTVKIRWICVKNGWGI